MLSKASLLLRAAGVLALLMSATLWTTSAHAGGLYLFDRGARPLGRGGAFVAGVDDPNALWYNPAGLAESGNQVMGDATLSIAIASVQRTNPDGSTMAKVDAKPLPIPIPQLGFSNKFGMKNVTFGAGIFAPNVLLVGYPRSIGGPDGTRLPSPTRYSLINLNGSLLSTLALGLAYSGIKGLSLGGALHLTGGRFAGQAALNACDGTVCTFPEDPAFDAYAKFAAFPVYGISGILGATWNIDDRVRFGASVVLPYTLRGSGTLSTRLPDSSLFDGASVQGNKMDFSMKMPTIVRVGSEIRPVRSLRLEGAVVWEQWSRQKSIDIKPQHVTINNVTGVGDYQVGAIKLQRNMNNVYSIRGGFEFFPPASIAGKLLKKQKFAVRGGLAYEKSAFTNKSLSPLTLDSNKVIISGGLSIDLAKWLRFDTVLGLIHMLDPKVRDSQITQPTALRPAYVDASTLGNGNYKMEAFFLGGGFAIKTN
ncbi:MAG: rane protein in aromatic hydrocarbon degradation [Myxococcaceae bacterium]|nr:rane protein in aromatic hydrocarbon degradation [Myxococcaceae bacterium]